MKIMKNSYFLIFLFFVNIAIGQNKIDFIAMDLTLGKTSPANQYFPKMEGFTGISFSIGKKHTEELEWVKKLNFPSTGLLFQYNNYGNQEFIGNSYSVLSFIEHPLFKYKDDYISLHYALGISFFDTKFDYEKNWYNRAVSTDYTWAFRLFFNYNFHSIKSVNYKLGMGYIHHSNGHTKWPNQGHNTFVLSFNSTYNLSKNFQKKNNIPINHSKYNYFSTRIGYGQQSLSRFYNHLKDVFVVSATVGKVYDKTYKVGLGLNYKFYQSYYDYITENQSVVKDFYPELKNNPFYNASSYGLNINGEILLNHFAIETEIGLNFDKSFYKVDYRLNEGKYINNQYQIAELNNTYRIKKILSTRLGLKYYLINTQNNSKNNYFVGAFINSNLGQADFTELSVGYVHNIFK